MAGPTRRERLGITPEMIEAFGPIIFDLSLNVQDRCGDPVRLFDFGEVERQRAAAGWPIRRSRRGSGSLRIKSHSSASCSSSGVSSLNVIIACSNWAAGGDFAPSATWSATATTNRSLVPTR